MIIIGGIGRRYLILQRHAHDTVVLQCGFHFGLTLVDAV